MSRLDPEGMRAFATDANQASGVARGLERSVAAIISNGSLTTGAHAPTLLNEIADEAGLLADLCRAKAQQMELADMGLHMPSMAALSATALDRLVASLNDDVGDTGMAGNNAINTLANSFVLLDTDGDGYIHLDELFDAAANGSLPPDLRAAADYMANNPVLAVNAAAVSYLESSFNDDYDHRLPSGVISEAGLTALAAQNEVLTLLSDRSVFDELESANNGERDNRLSGDDLWKLIDDPGASDEARQVATFLIDNPAAFAWFDQGRMAATGGIPSTFGDDGKISYEDIFAVTIGQHAFADDPAGARDFIVALADQATWTDVSGKKEGIDIRLSSDDGLRALAAAALSDSATLLEQVEVVATMPESQGGVRNQLITFYYADLADKMNVRLNGEVLAPDPTSPGHTGANWMVYAPWASYSVGPLIRGEESAYGVSANWSDRQFGADGNQYIFGDVAIRYAMFLDRFPADQPISAQAITDFFGADHPLLSDQALFADGHRQLRDSFAYYLAAADETDPEQRQILTMRANILIATHEQAGAQHALAGIVDQSVADDGWIRMFAGEVGGFIMEGSDEQVATNRMSLTPGVTGQPPVFMRDDVPEVGGSAAAANLILDDDLSGVLNPEGITSVGIGSITVGFDGSGDVPLDPLTGWSDPVEGSGVDWFPTDVAEWEDRAGFELTDDDREFMEFLGQDPDALPATYGTGATNWADPHERQWFISNMFHQFHTEPSLIGGLGDLTIDGDWADVLGPLPESVAAATE